MLVDPPEASSRPFPDRDLGRPVRVVLFGGAFFEPALLEFIARLDEHPEIEFLGGFCQSPGFGVRRIIANVVRRRGIFAPAVLGTLAAQAALRVATHPRAALELRRRVRRPLARVAAVSDIHAAANLDHVRDLAPDLGLVYGSPILKPQLFEIPRFGTLGIHHGRLPAYRGKKTVFWAMLNGEHTTGVTIQRVSAGVDTGEIVCEREVSIGGRRYGRVDAEVQALGVDLYMAAILAVKRGHAACRPQPVATAALYRQPAARDILRLWLRQLTPERRHPEPDRRP